MIRRLPVIPTLIVLAAVVVMVRLGFWQLDRLAQKEALLAQYAQADRLLDPVKVEPEPSALRFAYRRVTIFCGKVDDVQQVAGHNRRGETGWAQVATCSTFGGFHHVKAYGIVLGWSKGTSTIAWNGGEVSGVLVPFRKAGIKFRALQPPDVKSALDWHVVADPPLAGLQPNAKPDPNSIPNNPLSYAVQWFLFALTALVIYALVLRKRLQSSPERGE